MRMGKLITFEGPDTCGKTTTINKLKTALPIIFENENFMFTREPGNLLIKGSNIPERIRYELLTNENLSTMQQAKLFAKARLYHIKDIIRELKKGRHVITDRFILSSLVYQGMEIGYDTVIEINKQALNMLKENDIEINNIVLHIDKETYQERISSRKKDAMELVDEETINKRIDFYINKESLNDLNIGNIYQIDANGMSNGTIIQALNHIQHILNK